MKNLLLSISVIFITVLSFSSCESVGEAQESADKFFSAMKSNDYETALSFFDETMFEQHGKEKLMNLLMQRNNVWGKIISFSKYGFHTSTNNGVTTVVLKFKVDSEKGKVYERLEFIKRNDLYKLNGYFFNPDQSKIDEM